MKKPLYWTLIAIFGVIFLVCAGIVGRYLWDAYEHRQMQNDLNDLRNQATSSTSSTTGTTGTTSDTQGTTGTTGSNPTEPTTTNPTTEAPTEPTLPPILPELQPIYALNNHLVGWITIEGTENKAQGFSGISYPVLQTPNTSAWHNYYLYRDFYGADDSHGSIYVRELCDVFKPSGNIVIYGHNMADGTMFGQVVNYRFENYYLAHKYIQFDTLYERHTYEIIAVFLTSANPGEGYTYHSVNEFRSEEEFNTFVADIKGASPLVYTYYNIPTTAEYGDMLITLSTCWNAIDNGRLVVVAKRIS